MKRVLITGSDGFLGRNLKKALGNEGWEIIELVSPRGISNSHKIFNSLETLQSRFHVFDIVFHLAAYIPYGAMNQESESLELVNVKLTQDVMEIYPTARWVFASSVAVFGSCVDRPITTHSTGENLSEYGLSKARAEDVVTRAKSHVIIRFASIVGPGMKATSMVPIMIERARNAKPIVVYGDGNRLQNYIDVRDAAQLLIQAAIFSENILTLGIGSREYSNRDVALIIRELTQAEVIFEGTDSSVGFTYDDRDMHQRLGFEPKYKLMETIRDIIAI